MFGKRSIRPFGASGVRTNEAGTQGPSLAVHLFAGLPTATVLGSIESARLVMPLVPLEEFADFVPGDSGRLGVLLPPFAEPSEIVESWLDSDFLSRRFGRASHLAGVCTLVDADALDEQLSSRTALAQRGWGKSALDGRSIADILVGQIESSTHLVLAGEAPVAERLSRRLAALNPIATCAPLRASSGLAPEELDVAFGLDEGGRALRSRDLHRARAREPLAPADSAEHAARVVPPWLAALRSEGEPPRQPGLFVYRRSCPFDPVALGEWLANPPLELVRGKGHVWLASEPDESFGYSCAGTVHRVFPSGRWWVSYGGSQWPRCDAHRRRLLERWHPRFGDRRQEIVFVGVDLDVERVSAGLDACLLDEAKLDDLLPAAREDGAPRPPAQVARLH